MWKVKKEELIRPTQVPELEPEESVEDLEAQKKELQDRLKKLETKKTESNPNQINKQEIIDIIVGNLVRINQLVEILRRI